MMLFKTERDWDVISATGTGTKIDLRENKEAIGLLAAQGLSPVKREQGIKLANKIRAVKYMECSALTQRGLKQVSVFLFLLVGLEGEDSDQGLR